MYALPRSVGQLLALAAASVYVAHALDASSCSVSTGDQQVGIQMISDASCNTTTPSYEGIGCIANSACRFCKVWETMQSTQFVNCTTLTTETFAATASASAASSASAATTCGLNATEADLTYGIDLVTDTSCSSGGLGCKTSVCRYCKTVDTPKSTFLNSCSDVLNPLAAVSSTPSNCTALVSSGDLEAGITAIEDDSCAVGGGIGCFESVCRYCQTSNTTKSANFLPCSNFMYTPATYPATASVTFYWLVFSGQTWTFPVTKSQQCHQSCAPVPYAMSWTDLPTTADPTINGGRSRIVFYQSNDCSDDGQAITIGDYSFPTVYNMTNIDTVHSFMIQETGLVATQPMQIETCAALGS